jgi:hypothetical protein
MRRLRFTSGQLKAAALIGLTSAAVCACGGSSSSPSGSTAATPPSAQSGTSGSSLGEGLGATGATGTTAPTATTAPPSPAKARFVVAADRVCLATDNKLEAQQAKVDAAVKAEQKKSTAGHRKALGSAIRQETSLTRAELTRLRALKPPAADRAVVARYLAAVGSQIQLVGQFATAVDDNDAAGVTTVSAKLTLGETTVENLAGGYGFKVCGSTASPTS